VDTFSSASESERKMLASLVDDLFKKLEAFNWDEYVSRLSIDGNLSDGEKRHLEIIKKIFSSRKDAIQKQKTTFNKLVGIA
jgi:Fe-S cluster assembly ATPase SufC